MRSVRRRVVGVAVIVGLLGAGPVGADVIHLKNGSRIQVEAWRDVGEAVEFASGGGIIRISKTEISRIEGTSPQTDLRMYSAPASATSSTSTEKPGAKDMLDVLRQGEGLFAQSALSSKEKASAFRRLGERWRALEVPEALREAHARAQQAFQIVTEAFTADDEGTAPNTKEQIASAKTALLEALEQLKKAAGEQS